MDVSNLVIENRRKLINLKNSVVLHVPLAFTLKLSILPTECISALHMALAINSDHFS
jgi:hypothetical protein